MQDGKSAYFEHYQQAKQCAIARTEDSLERWLLLISRWVVCQICKNNLTFELLHKKYTTYNIFILQFYITFEHGQVGGDIEFWFQRILEVNFPRVVLT